MREVVTITTGEVGFARWRSKLVAYISDRFNRLDIPAIVSTIVAVTCAWSYDYDVGNGQPTAETRTARSIAACFLWLRSLRVLIIFPSFGAVRHQSISHTLPRSLVHQAPLLTHARG